VNLLIKRNVLLAAAILLSISLPAATGPAMAQAEEQYFFTITNFVPTMFDMRVAEILSTEYAKIGINVEIETGDFGVWIDRAGKMPATHDDGGFDMSLMTWAWGSDPDMFGVFHSTMVRPFGWNVFDYKNGDSDRLWEEQLHEMDFDKRKDIISEIMALYLEDPPMIPINYQTEIVATAADLQYHDAYGTGKWLEWAETFKWGSGAKDNIVWAYGSDHKHMNPVFISEGGSDQFDNLVFDSLVRYDFPNKAYAPNLATSWEYNEETDVMTFHLRDDVYWHDGEKFTANDVVFTYTAIGIPEVGSVYADLGDAIEEVVAVDDYTVEMKFKEPFAPGISRMSWLGIIPEHILGSVPYEDWQTHPFSTESPIGTGPYKLQEWKPDEYTHFVANENYHNGAPPIENLFYRVVPDRATVLVALENGEVDVAQYEWTIEEYEHLQTLSQLRLDSYKPFDIGYTVCPNLNHPLLGNKYVRQAMSYAIPRDRICNDILGSHVAAPANQIYPPGWPWHNADLDPIPYDIEKAKSLMELAGYKFAYISPAPPVPWTANLMPITTGLVVGLVIGVAGTWILKKK
jgi:ABC-type transport system substrate-binding protein